jgi:hypothetical protein
MNHAEAGATNNSNPAPASDINTKQPKGLKK